MFAFGVGVGVGILFGVGVGVADMSTLGLSLDMVRYFFVATLGFGHGEIRRVGVGE